MSLYTPERIETSTPTVEIVAEPEYEPVTISDVKQWLGLSEDDPTQDNTLDMLISSAREGIELYCGISLVEKTIILHYDSFCGGDELHHGPIQEIIDVYRVIDGIDENDEEITDFKTYGTGYLKFDYPYRISTKYSNGNRIKIQAKVGYPPGKIPALIKKAMLKQIAYDFDGDRGEMQAITGVTVLTPEVMGMVSSYRKNQWL